MKSTNVIRGSGLFPEGQGCSFTQTAELPLGQGTVRLPNIDQGGNPTTLQVCIQPATCSIQGAAWMGYIPMEKWPIVKAQLVGLGPGTNVGRISHRLSRAKSTTTMTKR